MTNEQFRAIIAELRAVRVAAERPRVEPVWADYATAARLLCCSKRSIERLVSEGRIRAHDIAGPKLRVDDLRALGERRAATPRQKRTTRSKKTGRDELMERVKVLAAGRENTP